MSDDYMNNDDDDEVIIGDDDSPNSIGASSNSTDVQASFLSFNSFLQPQVNIINQYLPHFEPKISEGNLKFKILSNVLPSSLRMVCGFYISPVLIEVSLAFQKMDWETPLSRFSVIHPIYNQNYIGRPLICDTIRNFFSGLYTPKKVYRSESFLFTDDQMDEISYPTHQILFLILEIVESLFDLLDHCCICRQELPFNVIKPTICTKKLCEVAFNEIGVGTSVAQEIRRDIRAADLLFSLFACSTIDPRYMNPCPPPEIQENMYSIFESLPTMRTIAFNCKSDADIVRKYGSHSLELLRWVLLTNKAQLIHLPDKLKLKNVDFPIQFMTLIATPQAEKEFLFCKGRNNSNNVKKKKKFLKHLREYNNVDLYEEKVEKMFPDKKTQFLWHGSSGERWHSIFRNGLKNMSNIDCVNGAAFGPGIYLAKDPSMSLMYVNHVNNLYKNSELGKDFALIALCEVASSAFMNDFGTFATLQDESAIIVRFVFPVPFGNNWHDVNAGKVTKSDIPSMEDVLNYLKEKDLSKNSNIE